MCCYQTSRTDYCNSVIYGVTAVVAFLSVCPSITLACCIETTGRMKCLSPSHFSFRRQITVPKYRHIGIGDGDREGARASPPKKKSGKIFFGQSSCKIRSFGGQISVKVGNFVSSSGKYHARFGNFVNIHLYSSEILIE